MLIAYTDVKLFIGIPTAETGDDTIITNACTRAQSEAERYCRRHFEKATYTEYKDGNGMPNMVLDEAPVVSITSLHDDLDRDYNDEDLIDPDDYIIKHKEGIVKLDGLIFSEGINNVKCVYVAGYGQSSPTPLANEVAVPDELKQALIMLAVAIYLEGKAGVNTMVAQDMIYRPGHMRKEAYKILEAYVRYGQGL